MKKEEKPRPYRPFEYRFWYRFNPGGKLSKDEYSIYFGGGELHIEDCPFCLSGQFRKKTWRMGLTAYWIGPFDRLSLVWHRLIEGENPYLFQVRPILYPVPKLCECILKAEELSDSERQFLNHAYSDSPPFAIHTKKPTR